MKIVCDACQAKYSISDDKVQGKVFKIRCKKCSNIIVVHGGASTAEPAPQPAFEKDTRVHDYGYDGGGAPAGDEAVWHVVINQDQVGPMTAADVQARFSAGEIDAETYIWREGFADWMPMMQVDQFAGFVASGSQTAALGGAGAVASMFGGGGLGENEVGTVRSDPGDLFAAASSSARHGDDDGGDLFGSKPSSRAAAGDAAASKLRGERNENSVLFSLNNLAQLASDKPAPVTAAPSSSSAGHATGSAGGEGSGLIDIRSMANAYLGGSGGAAKPATASIGSIDDLPVFGGGGFSEPAVIVPTARATGNSKLMYALIGSVGLLVVAAVVLVFVMLKSDKDKPAQVASNGSDEKKDPEVKPDQPKPDPVGGSAAAPPVDPGTKPETGSGSAVAEKPADPKPAKADTKADAKPDPKPERKPPVKRDPRPTSGVGAVAKTDPKPKVVEKTVEPSGGGNSCDEVSCVLNNYEGACCQKFRKGGGKPATGGSPIGEKPKSDLPDSLDRTMISEGVGKVKARVMACGDKSSAKGQVKVSVKVNPDGSVSSVTVKNTPDVALGNCVGSAMQRATFKRTASGGSFGYPFVF